MSTHIKAKLKQVATSLIFPGDPIRAEKIANYYMKTAKIRFNGVRGMYGYTGKDKAGNRFTCHASGMGQPTLAIYAREFAEEYFVDRIIRIGTCGSFHRDLPCGTIFIPQAASTDSAMNKARFESHVTYSAIPEWDILQQATEAATRLGIEFKVGNIFSTDHFYDPKEYMENEKKTWEKLVKYGIFAVEMESYELFSIGAEFGIDTLSILTVSDNLVTEEKMSPKNRENCFKDMMKIALELI